MPEQSCLRALNAEPAGILARVSDGVVGVDSEWRYVYVNESALEMLERRAEELLGKNIWSVYPTAMERPIYRAALQAMATNEVALAEDYDPDFGKWFECRLYPSSNGLSIFFHDISARKRVEQLLRGQSQILELIAHGTSMPRVLDELLRVVESLARGMRSSILLMDVDGLHMRHGAAPSLPLSFTQAVDGAPIGPQAGSCGTAAYTAKPVVTMDIATDPKWADFKHLALPHGLRACWSTPIFDDADQVLGTFALYYGEVCSPNERDEDVVRMATHLAALAITRDRAERDRTERERIERRNKELEERNRAIQEASRLKSQFLANMSHELRTPLNAINGFSEYLIDLHAGPLTAKQLECLQYVLSSGRHLLRLVSDVLDLAKVEAGKLELFPERCLVVDVLGEVCSVVNGLAREKLIALDWRCEPPLEQATLDVQKFKQVMFNLLANAVKFTNPGGSVRVLARLVDAEHLEVRVADTGIGISPADLSKLFVRFQQLDHSSGPKQEGTGLGLALSKRLVECQGGTIGVESELGRGSTFYFTILRELPASGG